MILLKLIFWVSLLIIVYSYLLYGVLLWILLQLRKAFPKKKIFYNADYSAEVTLLVAIYNEEAVIREKIQNTLDLNYPEEKLDIIFVTDGSTDKTNSIIREYKRINLLFNPQRKGKVAAINRAMQYVKTPIVVFCDANTILNRESIKEIVKHYADPKVGGVSGEKIIRQSKNINSIAGTGEGLYWKYESLLKRLDSEFRTVVGAAGELFSIRTELFEQIPENVLLDDFVISLRIAQKGYKVVYEPAAYAVESPSMDMNEEQKRKIRISAGGFQSILLLYPLLNIFKYPILSFQYISHRVLRWAICPFLLPVIFLLNAVLLSNTGNPVYGILMVLQILFYLAAFIGYLKSIKNQKSRIFYVPYYFVFMNISLYLGLLKFIGNRQSVLWDKAKRQTQS